MSNVRKLALVALTAAVSAAVSVSAVLAFAAQPLRLARLQDGSSAYSVGPAAVRKAADGHFWANAQVNGQPVRFLVDTGATAVALTPADAERLGFRPFDLDYGRRVITAGGASRAAAVTLSSVSVDGARLEDVDALVVERGLDVSLLGMSYLGRLARFEANREALVLQP